MVGNYYDKWPHNYNSQLIIGKEQLTSMSAGSVGPMKVNLLRR